MHLVLRNTFMTANCCAFIDLFLCLRHFFTVKKIGCFYKTIVSPMFWRVKDGSLHDLSEKTENQMSCTPHQLLVRADDITFWNKKLFLGWRNLFCDFQTIHHKITKFGRLMRRVEPHIDANFDHHSGKDFEPRQNYWFSSFNDFSKNM